MNRLFIILFFVVFHINVIGQVIIGPKGTKVTIDSSKWTIAGNDIYNKNAGRIGIGTASPSAQLHTTSDVRFEGIGTSTSNTKILTADALGNITTRTISNILSSTPISNEILSQVPSQTFKGRATSGTGNVEDLTAAQATAILNTFTSTSRGLVPPSGGGATTFLRADGVFATPVTSDSRTLVTLTSDVVNNAAAQNTLQDVTGLSFPVIAGNTYRFYAMIPYTSAQTNNGSRWTISGPAVSFVSYVSRYPDNEVVNYCGAFNLPTGCSVGSIATANIAIIQGVIRPSANGTVQVRFASENGAVAITAKAGASLEYW